MALLYSSVDVEFDVSGWYRSAVAIEYNYAITNVAGYVVNKAGQYIANARIFWYPFWGPAVQLTSDSSGFFCITEMEGCEGTLVIPEMEYDRKIIFTPMAVGQAFLDFRQITSQRFSFPTVRFNI